MSNELGRRPLVRLPQPGELLSSFVTNDGQRVVYELRVREGMWEAQFFIAGEFHSGRLFPTREGAERWVQAERLRIERDF
jgi:hypothetical protein